MIVVSDTTPLNYLVLVKAVNILPRLFAEVYAPPEILTELQHESAPLEVREWANTLPGWIKIASPTVRLSATAILDRGEAAAISLAKELNADAVLIDERKGARLARSEGLLVVRSLALLELAAERNLLDLPLTIGRLQKTSFRISTDHLNAALQRDAARKLQG